MKPLARNLRVESSLVLGDIASLMTFPFLLSEILYPEIPQRFDYSC
jgi:hypothetical protein